jgi:hypothetical protein
VAPPRSPPAIHAVQNGLDDHAEDKAVAAARAQFDGQLGSLGSSLRAVRSGRSQAPLSPAEVRAVAKVITDANARIVSLVTTALNGTITATRGTAVEEMRAFIARHERGEVGALSSRAAANAVSQARAGEAWGNARSILRQWAVDVNTQVNEAVRLAVQRGARPSEIGEVAQATIDASWWRVERLVRTETAYAFNAVADATVAKLATQYPDVRKRWTERVDDRTGKPLDNRVAVDSLVLHGQLAKPGGLFTMPAVPLAPPKMVGRAWAFPPNRPNDRAVVLPWRPGWGIPGWVLRGGRVVRVAATGRAR